MNASTVNNSCTHCCVPLALAYNYGFSICPIRCQVSSLRSILLIFNLVNYMECKLVRFANNITQQVDKKVNKCENHHQNYTFQYFLRMVISRKILKTFIIWADGALEDEVDCTWRIIRTVVTCSHRWDKDLSTVNRLRIFTCNKLLMISNAEIRANSRVSY